MDQARCSTKAEIAERVLPERRPIIRSLALVLVGLLLSAAECQNPDGGVVEVLSDLQREESRISVLTLNLRGIHEQWGGQGEGAGATVIPWRDRYERVATWMESSQTTPDIISLQEVWGYKKCPFSDYTVRPYDTLFELITRIRAHTGVEYRIAYLVGGRIPQGLCELWSGHALLYNPKRIRNIVPHPPSETVWDHEATAVEGVHLRASLPCTNVTPGFENECKLIDGAGLAWQLMYTRAGGRRVGGPTFARLELERQRGLGFHVYTEHLDFNDYPAAKRALKDTVDKLEERFGQRERLFPPIMAGDFNISLNDIRTETTEPGHEFDMFEIAGYTDNDVVGVLIGDRDKFSSKFALTVEQVLVLPTDQRDPSGFYCGLIADLWSDHCGIFVRFIPPPSPP